MGLACLQNPKKTWCLLVFSPKFLAIHVDINKLIVVGFEPTNNYYRFILWVIYPLHI